MPMEAVLQIRFDIGHYIQPHLCIICLYILIYTFRNEAVIIVTLLNDWFHTLYQRMNHES
jgi:hypothetical protein